MKPRIFIRADGGPQIGLGHVTRCVALAHMIKDYFTPVLVVRVVPDPVAQEIVDDGFDLRRISDEPQFFSMLSPEDGVVLDGYHFDTSFQAEVQGRGVLLACIDDLHEVEFVADLIINHAPLVRSNQYRAKATTQFALGLDYALLRPVFLQQALKDRKSDSVQTALICFGGSDAKNLTADTLQVVAQLKRFRKIVVVTGAAYPYLPSLIPVMQNIPEAVHYHAIDQTEMAACFSDVDVAIVPASGILYEAVAAGCQVISGTYVDNQQVLFKGMAELGGLVSAGTFEPDQLRQALIKVLNDNKQPPRLIDGRSKDRMVDKFLGLFFMIRPVKEEDCKLLFEWANEKEVRSNAINQEPIQWDHHVHWFRQKIQSASTRIFILEWRGRAVGQIRYDRDEAGWFIDYAIAKEFRGKGFGKIIVRQTLDFIKPGKARALVKDTNVGSARCFEALFFKRMEMKAIAGNRYQVFEKEI